MSCTARNEFFTSCRHHNHKVQWKKANQSTWRTKAAFEEGHLERLKWAPTGGQEREGTGWAGSGVPPHENPGRIQLLVAGISVMPKQKAAWVPCGQSDLQV